MIVTGGKSYRKVMDGPFGRRYYTILYAIEAPAAAKFKIGRTLEIHKRFSSLCTASPSQLILRGAIWLPDDAEESAHTYLKDHWSHGEWFNDVPTVRELVALIAAKRVREISAALGMDWMLVT